VNNARQHKGEVHCCSQCCRLYFVPSKQLQVDRLVSVLNDRYPAQIGLGEPTDDIYALLQHISKTRNFYILHESRLNRVQPKDAFAVEKDSRLDVDRAARFFLDEYREGKFGAMTLDDCRPEAIKAWFEDAGQIVAR
jgi:ribosome biogenesis GTPase A